MCSLFYRKPKQSQAFNLDRYMGFYTHSCTQVYTQKKSAVGDAHGALFYCLSMDYLLGNSSLIPILSTIIWCG